jgi:NAD(P)-dependent dehydrogenase (short-subunit alcohol dehydrogenase family)
MKKSLTVLITGTNKGIGYDLVSIFLKKHPDALIYATSREPPASAQKRWEELDASHCIRCRQLEVASVESIDNFAE